MAQSPAPNPVNCILGGGAIYFNRFDANGVKTGLAHLGNAKDLKASASSTRATLNNYVTADGGIYAEGQVSLEITVSALIYEFNKKNIALLTSGNETTYTQTTQTVSGETLTTSAEKGLYYETAYDSITVTSVVQGTTTLTTADYQVVSSGSGLIKLLTTGSATDGSPLLISYTAAPVTAQAAVDLYAAGTIQGQLLFVSANRTGANGEMKWYKVSVQQGDLDGLIGDDFGSSTISFKVLNDATGAYGGSVSSPYGRWLAR